MINVFRFILIFVEGEIMSHLLLRNKKTRILTVLALLILAGIVVTVINYNDNSVNPKPPTIYVNTEVNNTKTAIMGGYSWKYHNISTIADAAHPTAFSYGVDNIICVGKEQNIQFSTTKDMSSLGCDFTIESLEVYYIDISSNIYKYDYKVKIKNKVLSLQAPTENGEYIYAFVLKFQDRGAVNYGIKVRVNMPLYDMNTLSKYKSDFVGDNSNDSKLVNSLPAPTAEFRQQYSSVASDKELNIYYEPKSSKTAQSPTLQLSLDNDIYFEKNMKNNALAIFSLIKNVDKVKFNFRFSVSSEGFDKDAYLSSFSFTRDDIENKFGTISSYSNNMNLLQNILNDIDEIIYSLKDGEKYYVLLDEFLENNDKENPNKSELCRSYILFDGINNNISSHNEITVAPKITNNIDDIRKIAEPIHEDTIVTNNVKRKWQSEGYRGLTNN